MFTCCHPALAMEARVALTLRTLAGLSTAEIARAFLVPETTMSKRLTRAKQKIQHAGIPYRVPPAHLLPERTPAVLAVLYLLFNEGYTRRRPLPQSAAARRSDWPGCWSQLMPDEPEAGWTARTDAAARRAPRDPPERRRRAGARWRTRTAPAGTTPRSPKASTLLDPALPTRRSPGRTRCRPPSPPATPPPVRAADTDWPQIAALYAPAPSRPLVVALNRAVADRHGGRPAVGLRLVDELAAGPTAGYHLLPATRADLLRRLGRRAEAATAYRRPSTLATTEAERRYLASRLAEVSV